MRKLVLRLKQYFHWYRYKFTRGLPGGFDVTVVYHDKHPFRILGLNYEPTLSEADIRNAEKRIVGFIERRK